MAASDIDRDVAAALATALRTRRKAAGLTQEQLAARAEIDVKYYGSLENAQGNSTGRAANPSLQIIRKLADSYGVSVPDLMFDVFGSSTKPDDD